MAARPGALAGRARSSRSSSARRRTRSRDFKKWGFDIIPHRALMKQGFETPDGKRVDVEDAFKDPKHPFRVAIVCAMWLTGFDVECLSTLYIDKPMKAHTLMQAIARANRVYPGKDFGLIVDYNGMLKSLREALAQYALGDDERRRWRRDRGADRGAGAGASSRQSKRPRSICAASASIRAADRREGLHADRGAARRGRRGLHDRRERSGASRSWRGRCSSASRRCSWSRSVCAYAERHDNIEAIYKKLEERRDTADVTELLKELHRIVNEAIRTQEPGDDQADGLARSISARSTSRSCATSSPRKCRRRQPRSRTSGRSSRRSSPRCWRATHMRMDYYKEVSGDHRRLQSREGSHHRRGDVCKAYETRFQNGRRIRTARPRGII